MKIHNVRQGTEEWARLRIGIPTASCFAKIITPKTLKPSSQADMYMCQLIAEAILGMPLDAEASQFMERGSALEKEAVAFYELERDTTTAAVGFVTLDDGSAGCSPDRLVGDDGLLEIKCPSPAVHVAYRLGVDAVAEKYKAQAQGQLWITGRRWVDCLSYHPDMPPALTRTERDEAFIEALAAEVQQFNLRLEAARATLAQKERVA